SQPSHLTVWPAGLTMPVASNLNFVAGQTAANLVVAKVGDAGQVSIFNNAGSVEVIADVVGYYKPATGSVFTGITPTRVLDSRDGTGAFNSPWTGGQSRDLTVAGGSTPIPSNATAVVINLTGVNPSLATHITTWPTGQTMPVASTLNLPSGDTRA